MIKPWVLFALLCLAGCATAPRYSSDIEGRFHHFTVKHQNPASQAFSSVELALAELYNDLPRVLKLRQPETGTFLLKPLLAYRMGDIGGPFFSEMHCRYTLKIAVTDSTVSIDIELGPHEPEGTWPPVGEMKKINDQFQAIAVRIAQAVNGTIS